MSLHRKLTKPAKGSLPLWNPAIYKSGEKYIVFIIMGFLRASSP